MDPNERFDRLYRAHADAVHAYAVRRSSSAAADDVVAEVFLVAWRRLGELPEEPLPWLYGTARRVLANRQRGESRAAALRARLAGAAIDDDAADRAPTPRDDLASTGSGASDARVREALAGLAERDRELLQLIAWEGLRPAEAAEALGIRAGTLSVRLHRARRRLAAALVLCDEGASARPADPRAPTTEVPR